ncbi:MAG: hypothetical protein GY862_03440 [Gammaproteobacteria bacterium]|nr:hypothetical protein [Gammaproteobacteria bacterium]
MESEAEAARGFTDLTMIVRPDMRWHGLLDILIEFKYVSLKEAGLSGEQLAQLEEADLRNLPVVKRKQREAEAGLARYQDKLRDKFGDILNLHSFSVTAVGFERLTATKT